jgi:putative membrane protein
MSTQRNLWVAGAIAVAGIAACAGTQSSSTTTTATSAGTTAGGDVALMNRAGGMWLDSSAGFWMDTTGAVWLRVTGGTKLEMLPSDVVGFNNANIVAHLSLGDSLEVEFSRPAETRGEHASVRDFAHRMVKEHSAHMQTAMQMASQGGLAPAVAMTDTADARMATRVRDQLADAHGAEYDRKFMRDEVLMHQHMLHDLTLFQSQATGAALQLVNETIPVVRKHLEDAQTILYEVSSDKAKSGGTPPIRP